MFLKVEINKLILFNTYYFVVVLNLSNTPLLKRNKEEHFEMKHPLIDSYKYHNR